MENSIFKKNTIKKVKTSESGESDKKRSKSTYKIPNSPNNWLSQIVIKNILVRFFN